MGASHNSKITRSAQVAAGAFAPVFALPTSWGPDVRQFGKFKWRTPERAADKLPCGQLRVIQNVKRNSIRFFMKKRYWSQRKGLTDKFDLGSLKRLFKSLIISFEERGFFQEYFGYHCVDAGFVPGKAGENISEYILRKTRREIEWPLINNLENIDEDILFDMMEFHFDAISHPIDGFYHSYSDCGYHYETFDTAKGQEEYRNELNEILQDYGDGYQMNMNGEIQLLLSPGLRELTDAKIPANESEKNRITLKIERAVSKYRDRHSSLPERREAVRELADVLEYLRSVIKEKMLTKDEKDLFNIANNFSIRHNNKEQKEDYDQIWLSWIFYLYLSTIHLCLRIRND